MDAMGRADQCSQEPREIDRGKHERIATAALVLVAVVLRVLVRVSEVTLLMRPRASVE